MRSIREAIRSRLRRLMSGVSGRRGEGRGDGNELLLTFLLFDSLCEGTFCFMVLT
jgi:hypothetical protein